MSRKAHMTHQRVTAKFPIKGDEMTSDDNFLETAVAADSVGKSEVELRAQRADTFAGLVTALAVDVAKELTVLSAMDIEIIDPARHVETMTALLEADARPFQLRDRARRRRCGVQALRLSPLCERKACATVVRP